MTEAEREQKRVCGLITDFGNTDYFVGTMKAVMKRINPGIEVIDITNEIPSFDPLPASFVLDKTYRYFPKQSIFLVVVDPGVGSRRNILLVECDDRYFIGPDNGVLTPVLRKEGKKAYHLDKPEYFLIDGFSTFEARDKMSPAAAHLSTGVTPEEMAYPVANFVVNPHYYPRKLEQGIEGRVVYIDKFGNVMTNITRPYLFVNLQKNGFTRFSIKINNKVVKDFYQNYSQAGQYPFMLIGSHQNLEIALDRDSAAEYLGVRVGQPLEIHFY